MKLSGLHLVFVILVASFAGCLGATLAVRWDGRSEPRGLHEYVHHELDLDDAQEANLQQLEESFTRERTEIENALRRANLKLAAAMADEQSYGPEVAKAIDRVHVQMNELQKATIRHVFAMRRILREDQQERFDRQVWTSLTGTGPE